MNEEITGNDLFEEFLTGYLLSSLDQIIPDIWKRIEEKTHEIISASIARGDITPEASSEERAAWARKTIAELKIVLSEEEEPAWQSIVE